MNKKSIFYKKILTIFSLLGACIYFSSCQTVPYQPYARDVKRKPQEGGIIALKTEHRDEDRQKAESIMATNCSGKGFKILEEGEVVVGEKTNSHANQSYDGGTHKTQVGSLFGVPLVSGRDPSSQANSEATTTQLKEWQISYACDNEVKTNTKTSKTDINNSTPLNSKKK